MVFRAGALSIKEYTLKSDKVNTSKASYIPSNTGKEKYISLLSPDLQQQIEQARFSTVKEPGDCSQSPAGSFGYCGKPDLACVGDLTERDTLIPGLFPKLIDNNVSIDKALRLADMLIIRNSQQKEAVDSAIFRSSVEASTLLDYSFIKAEKKGSGFYKYKRVISGNHIEDYKYEKTQNKKKQGNKEGRVIGKENTEYEKIKALVTSGNRAKREIKRLVNANIGKHGKERPKFFTITFADNIQDMRSANYEFKKLLLRLNYHVYKEKCNRLEYLCVVQFQARGAIHWHVIFFNLPFVPVNKLAEIWGQGFVKINAIDDVDNVGSYVSSYVGNERDGENKGSGGKFIDERYINEKRYFRSKGLYKYSEIISYEPFPEISEPPQYMFEYENEYTGKVIYSAYKPQNKQIKKEYDRKKQHENKGGDGLEKQGVFQQRKFTDSNKNNEGSGFDK